YPMSCTTVSFFFYVFRPPSLSHLLFFFFSCSRDHLDLHSFPTRPLPISVSSPTRPRRARRPSRTLTRSIRRWLPSARPPPPDRRSEEQRLNSSHVAISYAVFCLKKKKYESWLLAR